MISRCKNLLLAALLAVVLTSLSGCQSAKQPGSMSHASVQIPGRSGAEIEQVALTVFREEGYVLTFSTGESMVFERPGSRRDAVKWGGLTGQGVNLRVKVKLSTMPDGSQFMQADAYAVQIADDPFFQTESRNILLNRRPYQKLLNEVARRLK